MDTDKKYSEAGREMQRETGCKQGNGSAAGSLQGTARIVWRGLAVWGVFCLCAAALTAFADVEQSVNELLPKLATAKVEDRYSAQMELQSLAANAARPGAEVERAVLANVLAAKAGDASVPQPARVWIVRQLEHIGAAESVAILAALLKSQDAELEECARRALEKNPAPAASEVLRVTLSQGGPVTWRIGLIQSLGERGDTRAVELLSGQFSSNETAPVAASALGKIADSKAAAALWRGYEKGIAGTADGLVTAGNRLLAAGNEAAAKDLFRQLYLTGVVSAGAGATKAKVPPAPVQTRSAALIGWATADPESVRDSIVGALQQQEPRLQFAAVVAATVAFGEAKVGAALAPFWPRLSPTAKTYILRVLDASAEKEVIAVAAEAEEQVQLAALERLGEIGSAASIPALFQAATAGSSNAQKTAEAALAHITGPGADAAIAKLAGEGKAAGRVVAINALAQRYEKSASPTLLEYAGEADPVVSAAACAALARLGTDQEVDGLIELVRSGNTPGAAAALGAVASRTANKSVVTQKLITQTQTCAPQQLAPLFDVLAVLGGKEALVAVATAAAGSNKATKDAAIRALANWPEFPATSALLVVAVDPTTTRVHNVLAIQGIARLVKAAEKEPAAARLDVVSAALKATKRNEEKKLLLSALASVADRQAAEAIKPFLGDPQLRQEAGLAAMNLAETLRKGDKPAAKGLAQVVRSANLSEELNRKANAFLGNY